MSPLHAGSQASASSLTWAYVPARHPVNAHELQPQLQLPCPSTFGYMLRRQRWLQAAGRCAPEWVMVLSFVSGPAVPLSWDARAGRRWRVALPALRSRWAGADGGGELGGPGGADG